MPCKVLLLTQWFDPEPTIKGLPFARELVRLGFGVEVLTGFPNYPYGRLYPGYSQRWLQRETIDGVRISRVPLYPSHDQSALRRVMNYASFAFTSLLHEHQRRVQHLEGATQRLEETLAGLARRQSTLRQEEITEELEVIMLGADLVAPGAD